MCVCTWSTVRLVCPKYEVVMLQPPTVTPPYIGSSSIVTLKPALQAHLFLKFVCIFLLPHLYYPPPPPLQTHRPLLLKYALIITRSQPPLPAQIAAHLDSTRTCHPSASAARLCAQLYVPVSAAVPVTV